MSKNSKNPGKNPPAKPGGTEGNSPAQPEKPTTTTGPAPLKPGSLPSKPPKAPRGGKPNKGGRPKGAKDTKPRAPRAPDPQLPENVVQLPPGNYQMPGGVPMPPSAFAQAEEDQLKAAREAAVAIAETLGMVCDHWLPPQMSRAQKDALVAVWTPVIMYYQAQLAAQPWFMAVAVTAGMMGPRIGARIGKALADRNSAN